MASETKFSLAVIGCGTMASAVLTSLLKSLNPPLSALTLCTRTLASLDKLLSTFSALNSPISISYSNDNASAASHADIILLSHKPYSTTAVLSDQPMRDALKPHPSNSTNTPRRKLIISFLAGVSEQQILSALGSPSDQWTDTNIPYVIRVCPNVGAALGQSMTAILEPTDVPQEYVDFVTALFSRIGKVLLLPGVQFEVAVVLVGAAIAFTTVAVEGLLDGAVAEGVPRSRALEMVGQCLVATGMALGGGKDDGNEKEGKEGEGERREVMHPAVLRESVSSPRGCTIQGLLEVESRGVRGAMAAAIVRAVKHLSGMGRQQD